MANIGRIAANLVSGSQEATLALANINFDFSLVKVEAPAEYQGLGYCLSKRRRNEAEKGSAHITARKLGALFENTLPEARHVYEVYGRRVSEIAEMPKFNPKGTSADGPFADHVGADGTTIWAAAISGKGAIAVHLLACLLARLWTAPEAISIWWELTVRRRDALREQCSDRTFQISTLEAAQIQLTREQLAEWDASARAWLQTADEAKKTQQTQVMLILKNLSLPVTTFDSFYDGVMVVWSKALKTMNNLVQGMPQRVQDGAILLGLSAWHIYPDMCALGGNSTPIIQNDSLVKPGGIVTIGLQNADPDKEDGIYWSLPLAHLRFYGEPVVKTANVDGQGSKITMDQFLLVVLGSVLGTWGILGDDLSIQIQFLHTMLDCFQLKSLDSLTSASRTFIQSSDKEREAMSRLIKFGMRKCRDLLQLSGWTSKPWFGLTNMSVLLGLCCTLKDKLECLRCVADDFLNADTAKDVIIRYHKKGLEHPSYLYLRPTQSQNLKRDHKGVLRNEKTRQWVIEEDCQNNLRLSAPKSDSLNRRHDSGFVIDVHNDSTDHSISAEYSFVYGEPERVAVFEPKSRSSTSCVPKNLAGIQAVLAFLDLTPIDLFDGVWNTRSFDEDFYIFNQIRETYSNMPTATVNIKLASRNLHSWRWAKPGVRDPYSLAQKFACIATCETGELNIDHTDLQNGAVMAMSYGNSIYIAGQLLADPSDQDSQHKIHRITGNIGMPGLSLLVPPQNLRIPRSDYESWNQVNHFPFEGRMEDNFGATSMHLSFSDYKLPINLGAHGQRDQEAYFVESIVSVHDHGRWIADLDVVRASESLVFNIAGNHWYGILKTTLCVHSKPDSLDYSELEPMASIDSWAELLDLPLTSGVVRAWDNKFARLCTAAVAAQQNLNVCISGRDICWNAYSKTGRPSNQCRSSPETTVGFLFARWMRSALMYRPNCGNCFSAHMKAEPWEGKISYFAF